MLIWFKKKLSNFISKSPSPIRNLLLDIYIFYKYRKVKTKSISIFDFFKNKDSANFHIIDSNRKTYNTPPCYYPSSSTETKEMSLPPTYWAVLDKVSIIGGSNVVLTDKYILYERFPSNNVNYTDNAFDDRRELYTLDGKVTAYYNSKKIRSIDTAITLVCNYSANYYHFCYEFLSKLWLLQAIDKIEKNIPLIIDECILKIPQFREYFNYLNSDRDYITIGWRDLVKIDKAYILSSVNVIPPNFIESKEIRSSDVLFDFKYIEYLRNKMLTFSGDRINKNLNNKAIGNNRVFLSRKNSIHRKYNEHDVEEVSKKYGFLSISPEIYSIEEQIQIFANADIILSPSGAALTNIIYCKPGAKVLIFTSDHIDLSIFSSIAHFLQLKMNYLAEDINTNNIQTDFSVNIDLFEEWLKFNIC